MIQTAIHQYLNIPTTNTDKIYKCYKQRSDYKEATLSQLLYLRDFPQKDHQHNNDESVLEAMEYVATQTLIFNKDINEWNSIKQQLLIKLMKHSFLERDLNDTANEYEYNREETIKIISQQNNDELKEEK